MASAPMSLLLSEEDRQLLAERLRLFDQDWRLGKFVDETRTLPSPGTALRLPLLVGLAQLDLKKQWALAQPILVEDYLHAFPELQSERALLELVCTEFTARQAIGQPSDWTAFVKRFPHMTAMIRQRLEPTILSNEGPEARTLLPSTSDVAPRPATRQTQELPEQFGRYRILKRLGRGGMGAVYLALDTQLERQVALKVPLFDSANPALLDRFYREARLAATLHHPHLCSVHDVGEIGGVHYLTMPYIDGQTLAAWIKVDALVPLRVAVTLVRQAALAVHEAHQRGIIHRDLKPSNIMIDRRGEPIIMDFGLARRASTDQARLTQSNTILGTPVYMSPEQASGGKTPVGPSSDVYSLGVILYELLTGRVPFEGTVTDVLLQILVDQPPPPSQFRPGLDRPLEAICLRALAKKVEERYSTMAEFAAALGNWLQQSSGPPAPSLVLPLATPQAMPAPRPPAPVDSEPTVPVDKRRTRKARSAPAGSSLRWLLGCAALLCVVCSGVGLTLWLGVPKVVGWLERFGPDSSFSSRSDWAELDRGWHSPPDVAEGEFLLPASFRTGLGSWEWNRTSVDSRANLPEYNMSRAGYRASYSGFHERAEVFVWRITPQEKSTIFQAVIDFAKKSDRFYTQWGKKDASAITVRGANRRTTVWYRDGWLYLATGGEMVDTEEVLVGLIRTLNERVPPETGVPPRLP